MFYVTKELLKELPEDAQVLIAEKGLTMDEMEAMPPEEKAKLMGADEGDVKAPTPGVSDDDMTADPLEKVNDESKLSKPLKYGDEDQFETKLTDDGHMEELPNSKKNAIGNFDDAASQGMALLDKMASMPPPKKKPKKKVADQKELEGETDEADQENEDHDFR